MSRFRKIKKKKPKLSKLDCLDVDQVTAVIALVETYRKKRPGPKISIRQAYKECENKGYISKY